ncbi:hypothetical protein FOZ62_031191 [Perkinsus olseni]|uniref:Cilia- and flagella-associated protein 69 ARM repeats domain-containing protein n=1 Tax=Perkinsus olseni TaxID=32597 RepID=A0A7J6QNM0_PEROL|nr:hypothetical protein FOZ62_031191 [Perkinsus olseni]
MQCLSILCNGDQKRMKQLRKSDGVKIIIFIWTRPCSGALDILERRLSLGVCAVDCVWSCILGCKKSEEGFIINFNGVGHLLECLEVGPRVLKRQIIGCLNDLLETSALARLQFLQWNSPITLRSGVKLLLDLLVREQRSMGAVGGDGTIKDVNRPWNPTILSTSTSPHEATMGSSENCSDTNSGGVYLAPPGVVFHVDDLYDMRMRIYCLLSIVVGFDPPADIGERLVMSSTESLQSSTGMRDDVLRRETLTREERQQLEAIRLYPELRELELWQDLLEGTSSGVEPLTVGDRKWIEDSIAEHLTRACWVKNIQKQMVLAEEKADFDDMLLSIGNQVSAESMAGKSMPIKYSETYSSSGLKLFELPEGVEVEGEQPQRILVIKGAPDEPAVACIGGKSFEMKSLNNSNARLVCQMIGGKVQVACNQQDTFVLAPIGPRINQDAIASALQSRCGEVEGMDDRKRLKYSLQASDNEVDAFIDDPESKIVIDNSGNLIVMDESYIVETLDLFSQSVVMQPPREMVVASALMSRNAGRLWIQLAPRRLVPSSFFRYFELSIGHVRWGRSTPPLSVVRRLLASIATDATAKSRTNIELDEARIRVARAAQIVCQRGRLSLREFEEQFVHSVANTIGCAGEEQEAREEGEIRDLICSMIRDRAVIDDRASPPAVVHVDRSTLPPEPRARLKMLLGLRKYWDAESLSQWIGEVLPPNVRVDSFLMKCCRRVVVNDGISGTEETRYCAKF